MGVERSDVVWNAMERLNVWMEICRYVVWFGVTVCIRSRKVLLTAGWENMDTGIDVGELERKVGNWSVIPSVSR